MSLDHKPMRQLPPSPALLVSCLEALFLLVNQGGCRDCVRRFELDPVVSDLKTFEKQRAALAKQRKMLMDRIAEFQDKVYVNQKAAADLLRLDLLARTRRYLAAYRKIKVRTRSVRRVYHKELGALETLEKAYSTLLPALDKHDSPGIRRGLKLDEQAIRQLKAADLALQRLHRKFEKQ